MLRARGGAAFIWKWGAIYGVVLGVIQIIISLLPLGSFKTILDVLVWLVGFFVISLFAARQTGRVRTGALVGLVTGLIGGLIAVIFAIIQIATNGQEITQALNQAAQNMQHQGQNLSSSALHTIAVVGIVIGLIVTVALELGLGVSIGALGAWWDGVLPGQSRPHLLARRCGLHRHLPNRLIRCLLISQAARSSLLPARMGSIPTVVALRVGATVGILHASQVGHDRCLSSSVVLCFEKVKILNGRTHERGEPAGRYHAQFRASRGHGRP